MAIKPSGPEMFLYRHDHKTIVPYNERLERRGTIKTTLMMRVGGEIVPASDAARKHIEAMDPLMTALWKMGHQSLHLLGEQKGYGFNAAWTKEAMINYIYTRQKRDDEIKSGTNKHTPATVSETTKTDDVRAALALDEGAHDAPEATMEAVLAKAAEIAAAGERAKAELEAASPAASAKSDESLASGTEPKKAKATRKPRKAAKTRKPRAAKATTPPDAGE